MVGLCRVVVIVWWQDNRLLWIDCCLCWVMPALYNTDLSHQVTRTYQVTRSLQVTLGHADISSHTMSLVTLSHVTSDQWHTRSHGHTRSHRHTRSHDHTMSYVHVRSLVTLGHTRSYHVADHTRSCGPTTLWLTRCLVRIWQSSFFSKAIISMNWTQFHIK